MDIERDEQVREASEPKADGHHGSHGLRVIAGALVILCMAAFGFMVVGPKKIEQPVQYPHASHVGLGIACASCHTGALTGVHAGIPTTDACRLCHRKDRSFPKSPPELLPYLESDAEIPWIQLHRVERHVYFSHNRHVTLAGMDCSACHGDVERMERPFTVPAFANRRPGMDRCVACHREEQVSTDCHSCHR